MKEEVRKELETVIRNYPELSICKDDILRAYEIMKQCYLQGGLIMTCGNGGSASDAEHIVGELMKSFKLKRGLTKEQRETLRYAFPAEGIYLADNLQQGIPAISLVSQSAISSAFINDVAADMVFAQQVFGYGNAGDVILGISTSGNSKNIINACRVAKAFGIGTIGMTGKDGGKLRQICDVTICVPTNETYRVQEYHLPVYHTLCAMIEAEVFANQ